MCQVIAKLLISARCPTPLPSGFGRKNSGLASGIKTKTMGGSGGVESIHSELYCCGTSSAGSTHADMGAYGQRGGRRGIPPLRHPTKYQWPSMWGMPRGQSEERGIISSDSII